MPRVTKDSLAHERALAARDAQLKLLSAKVKSLLKEVNFKEAVKQAITDSVTALAPVKHPPVSPVTKQATGETFVIALSDLHYGEVVDEAEMGGFGRYNKEICAARLEYYSDKIRDFKHNKLVGLKFPKAVVLGLGDFVSGLIHDELKKSNDPTGVIQQAVECAYLVAQFLREIAAEFPEVRVHMVSGNHGRSEMKKEYKNRSESFDRLCYQLISAFLAKQGNIKFSIPEAWFDIVDIEGHNFFIQHGDNGVGYSSGGIPFYGMLRNDAKISALIASTKKTVQYFVIGHFHISGELDRNGSGELILCGTVKGGDEYALGKLAASGPSAQKIFGVSPKIGKTWSWKIILQDAPLKPARYTLYQGEVLGEVIAAS